MDMSPLGYDAETDFAATGDVRCGDCGARVTPQTLATLPRHGCAEAQRDNRFLLSMIVQRRVFREANGDVYIWYDHERRSANIADHNALNRLTAAEYVTLVEGRRESYYEITDRAMTDA